MEVLLDPNQLLRVANFLGWPRAQKEARPVRIGVLGASQVATYACVAPAKRLPSAEVVAVAARDGERARQYAQQQGIKKHYGSYDELLADPEIDVVYVGLPNGLHGQWARRALEGGKHVLCEKPFGANQEEAREVHAVARKRGLMCREAFHYREHPLAARLRELVLGPAPEPHLPHWVQRPALPGGQGGVLGPLKSVDVQLLIPRWVFGGANIRFQEQLAGGAMMDAGCYCASLLRLVSGEEPRVTSAVAQLAPNSKVVDGSMRAWLSWPTLPGVSATLHASLQHDGLLPETQLRVKGERGELECRGFVVPFFGHVIRVKQAPGVEAAAGAGSSGASKGGAAGGEWVERVYGPGQQTTYYHQLDRFVTDLKVLQGCSSAKPMQAVQTARAADAEDSVANMAVLDAVYQAAGLPVRLPTTQWLALQGSAAAASAAPSSSVVSRASSKAGV